jgi:hypothetical protein
MSALVIDEARRDAVVGMAQEDCRYDRPRDDDNDHHHATRTLEQQRAFNALHGDGGISSWERVLANAPPEKRSDLLQTALIDLYRLAAKAGVNHTDISDWGFRIGDLYSIGFDTDGLQAIIAEAIQAVISERSVSDTDSSSETATTPVTTSNATDWPTMDPAANHGLAGDFVNTILPHTEADPAGLLLHFLVSFGSVVGGAPYYLVESDKHHCNLYAVQVAESARGRKGTGAGRVRVIVETVDDGWSSDRNVSGLSSGEGLISSVRDQRTEWDDKGECWKVIDQGITDKRLLVTEAEFAATLSVMERAGNTLSSVIRNAWDSRPLQTVTKNSPLKATGAHIAIIGHITPDELRNRLRRNDMANGFANRFLFFLTKRSKLLPFGGHVDDEALAALGERLKQAVEFAKNTSRVTMTDAAAEAWAQTYPELSADRPGLLGAVTARAEAQVIRLALIYALLDSSDKIDTVHLGAAMAVWAYCDHSAQLIFGDIVGNPVADDILSALQRNPAGMTRTDISNLFGRHRTSEIGPALTLLVRLDRARSEERPTGGRPVETWFATGGRK